MIPLREIHLNRHDEVGIEKSVRGVQRLKKSAPQIRMIENRAVDHLAAIGLNCDRGMLTITIGRDEQITDHGSPRPRLTTIREIAILAIDRPLSRIEHKIVCHIIEPHDNPFRG